MTTVPRSKAKISAAVASLLVLSAVSQGSAARQDITAIAVFMNEGRTNIQVDVVSEDKKDKTILPLHWADGAHLIQSRTCRASHTASKDIVSGRLLSSRSMPTPSLHPSSWSRTLGHLYGHARSRWPSLILFSLGPSHEASSRHHPYCCCSSCGGPWTRDRTWRTRQGAAANVEH